MEKTSDVKTVVFCLLVGGRKTMRRLDKVEDGIVAVGDRAADDLQTY